MAQINKINTDKDNIDYLHKELTSKIIEAFYKVYNALGYGFLENVYQNSLSLELSNSGLKVEIQKPISVYYEGRLVGSYFADLFVEDKVIFELKACECICEEHEFQLVNYLKATGIEVGLLLNFGKKPEIKRNFFTSNKLSA